MWVFVFSTSEKLVVWTDDAAPGQVELVCLLINTKQPVVESGALVVHKSIHLYCTYTQHICAHASHVPISSNGRCTVKYNKLRH